ncbi:MAG: hypothetical protein IT348_06795 [Candidatus Eisenbacteria bacterium]|nr:hypothetical protein [Candidatus Eisenbacteria bacterium]
MSTNSPEDLLVEGTLGAWRRRDGDGLPVPPAEWADLTDAGRVRAYEAQLRSRAWERALDDDGLSSTVHAVLARIR